MNKTLTRVNVADAIYRKVGISHAESSELIDAVIEEIVSALENGDQVKLTSFGTFSIREKKERIGRNPKTKEEVPITARNAISFRPSNILAKRVNS